MTHGDVFYIECTKELIKREIEWPSWLKDAFGYGILSYVNGHKQIAIKTHGQYMIIGIGDYIATKDERIFLVPSDKLNAFLCEFGTVKGTA